jgi:hypothetical protein
LADDEYDEDGRLISSGVSAKVASKFPDMTVGTAAIFSDDVFTTPTLNFRRRVIPLSKKKSKRASMYRLITPDYLSIGFGAENILFSLQLELVPELITVGGGISFNTVDRVLLGHASFEFLEF